MNHSGGATPSTSLVERTALVDELVHEFTGDVLFALSLGSKELFHTNLLGWLAEHHRGVGDALLHLFNPETPASAVRAKREWHHLDLVLDEVTPAGDRGPARVVIENKMFALPDPQQLRDYGPVIRNQLEGSPSLILLSLADPGWPADGWTDGSGSVWRHCSYRSLASALTAALPPGTDPYVVATLGKWKDMLGRLDRLVDLVGQPEPDEPFLLPNPVRHVLASARLDGPIQKLRAHHLASSLRRELRDLEDVSIGAGLAHGIGLVEAFVPVGNHLEAGWQLQGSDWRMAIRVTEEHELYGRGDAQVAARALLAEQTGWVTFDQTPFTALPTGPTAKDGTPTYGRFSPDFVYRYVNVENISLQEATDAGAGIIRRAVATRDAIV